jgi:hypothetical protein
MEETKSYNEQLCHDLRPIFERAKPPMKLKKVRQRLQAQRQSVTVGRLIATHGLEELCRLTLRLVNEGSLQPRVSAFDYSPLIGADADVCTDKSGRTSVRTRSKWSFRRNTKSIFDAFLRYSGRSTNRHGHVR